MEEHANLHLSTYWAKKPNFFTLPPSVMRHIAWNEERGAAGSDAGARSKQVGFNSNQPIATNTRQRTYTWTEIPTSGNPITFRNHASRESCC